MERSALGLSAAEGLVGELEVTGERPISCYEVASIRAIHTSRVHRKAGVGLVGRRRIGFVLLNRSKLELHLAAGSGRQ
jgi:hypothetical protein